MSARTSRLRAWGACAFIMSLAPFAAFAADRFEEEPINYSNAIPDNPVSRLQEAIDDGTVTLESDKKFGYLKSVLELLNIPHESQVLVFSRTSFQNRYISPSKPRAVYYNDHSYIGTVRHGDVIEISTTDPKLGAVFYTLSQRDSARPKFVRQTDNCLQCHASTLTRGVPGHVVRSVFTDEDGFPILKAGTHITTQESPLEERWGGWYVTGTHGDARHMGNTIAVETERDADLDMESGANRATLDARVDPKNYLTAHSDIVSLMVLEHQTRMHNLISNANFETQWALRDQAVMDEVLKRAPGEMRDSTKRRIASAGKKLIDYMLFADEAQLTDPVAGTSGFAEVFTAQGTRDAMGRSFRDLDLKTRLFKYPLSYLIYSDQFDALPQEMQGYVYRRLWEILSGADETGDYDHLSEATRTAIRQILIDTKIGLPKYWTRG